MKYNRHSLYFPSVQISIVAGVKVRCVPIPNIYQGFTIALYRTWELEQYFQLLESGWISVAWCAKVRQLQILLPSSPNLRILACSMYWEGSTRQISISAFPYIAGYIGLHQQKRQRTLFAAGFAPRR
jgi:hypothetical protein